MTPLSDFGKRSVALTWPRHFSRVPFHKWPFFPLSGVLRRLSGGNVRQYALPQNLCASLLSEKNDAFLGRTL